LKEKKMKFIVELNNTKVLMTADQIGVLTNLLWEAEQITRKYIASVSATASTPARPSTYISIIDTFNITETLKFGAIATEEYDAMTLITKLHNESNA
jgi:hypothetical protein